MIWIEISHTLKIMHDMMKKIADINILADFIENMSGGVLAWFRSSWVFFQKIKPDDAY